MDAEQKFITHFLELLDEKMEVVKERYPTKSATEVAFTALAIQVAKELYVISERFVVKSQ